MKIRMGKNEVDLRPFVLAAIFWTVASLVLILAASDFYRAAPSWLLFHGLAVADLFFLVKTVAALLYLMSDQGAKNRSAYAIQTGVWGILKLACLGGIGFALSIEREPSAPKIGILLGIGTIVVVPLLGGWIWSQKQIQESE